MRSKVFTLLALLLTCTFTSMAQRVTVPSGFYWIYSGDYYLQPSSTSPYVTTARDRSPQAADIWKITSISEGDYTIRNFSTGATLVVPINANLPNLVMDEASRAQLVSNPTTHDYYTQNVIYGSSLQSVMIYPDNAGLNNLYSYSPRGYSHTTALSSGLIYLGKDNNPISYASRWTIEEAAVLEPSIDLTSVSGSTGTVTISPTELYDSDRIEYRYTTDGHDATTSSTLYTAPFSVTNGTVVHAIAVVKSSAFPGETIESKNAEKTINFSTTGILVSSTNEITEMGGSYVLDEGFVINSPIGTSIKPFTGTIDGKLRTIASSSVPLVAYANGATIKNVIIGSVNISSGNNEGDAGAICCKAYGASRIYNCGLLGGTVGGSHYVGGLVGLLDGTSRVINCYSYATINGGANSTVAGIVGYNNGTTTAASINTMVMNCMFYGDITGGKTVSPVYGGNIINNLQGGLSNFNYYSYENLKTTAISSGKYNCALAEEEKYLNRFEFYRLLLNSNKKLAAFYATGSVNDASQMAKWVLETADRTISNPHPYPILKTQGTYPSIINPDIKHAPDSTTAGPNKGGKLSKTLAVTISSTKTDGGQTWPSGAQITTTNLSLIRTDKDFDRFNYNYDKVQLPYYNDVGEGNYTGNRVVTGWKITAITAIADDPYTASNYPTTGIKDFPDHNYADRKSSNKDLYTISKRVFSQGAYFDVPYGVTSITIEPYWAKACYIADPYYDVVYKNDYTGKQNVTQTGTQVTVGTTFFNGQGFTTYNKDQRIETSVSNALSYINNSLSGYGPTVYDNAVVLVGNLHLDGVPSGGDNPFTMMSVDTDNDHEPDHSLIYHHKDRLQIAPIRFDFLNIIGTAQAQKPSTASLICNFTIFKTKGWFETTNTALFYTSQLEYENLTKNTKVDAPLILLGGVIDQFVSTQSSDVTGKTIYIHVGGNVWIYSFGLGTHSDGKTSTPHVPVSVTGGDYPSFYLTGTYQPDATPRDDNAECYISGGHFGEMAGACLEQIGANNTTTKGNVRWQIYNADIDNFFGGGINDANPVKGEIITDIFNSRVGTFCGGPKFGDMTSEKAVTTTAEGCTFDMFFGGGYGGNSYSRKKYYDEKTPAWGTTLQGYYITDRGKYFDGQTTPSKDGGTGNNQYGYKGPGVATDFDYEFFVWSKGNTGGRFYVKFISFSLAQCNDVNSTLKRCTINENFYGGGSLGKVAGMATSVLEDCTVNGNVFGAGFSATLPTIQVRDAGFTTVPNYNSSSGMFEPGVLSGTTEYTWKHVESYPSEGGAGFDGTQVITEQNIEKSNLGSVGTVTLTLKGSTEVHGNVYGGGDESSVSGNTTVTLEGKTDVLGNVFGGGNRGKVGGDSEVKILDSSTKTK